MLAEPWLVQWEQAAMQWTCCLHESLYLKTQHWLSATVALSDCCFLCRQKYLLKYLLTYFFILFPGGTENLCDS